MGPSRPGVKRGLKVKDLPGARPMINWRHDQAMKWEDENLDVLQNLEFSVAQVWRAHPEMTDYAALRAYEAAFKLYRDQWRGHTAKPPTLTGLDAAVFEAVTGMCEIRLGRRAGPEEQWAGVPPIPLEKLVSCLRELAKSVKRHTQMGGRQGYLNFIDKFLP